MQNQTAWNIVKSMKLGSRTAENEQNTLGEYFVETESWRKVYEGEVDLILAPKGGGKTAIYSMLKRRQTELFDRKILLIDAGDPTEETALREFTKEDINMFSIVIIGNSKTKKVGDWMITPRGYQKREPGL